MAFRFITASAVPRSRLYQSIGLRRKDAFKDGLRGSGESRLHAPSRRESHLQTEMTNGAIVIARLFDRVRIISKTSLYVARMEAFCQSRTREKELPRN